MSGRVGLPSRAQLRFLLALVAAGGEGYGADMVRRPHPTVEICRRAGWVDYRPVPDKPYEIGVHVITDKGRSAAIDSAPDLYKKRLAQASKAVKGKP